MGTITLNMFNRKEVFKIANASIVASKEECGVKIWVEYSADETPIEIEGDNQESFASPNADICFKIKSLDKLKEWKINIKSSYDEESNDYVSRFYYHKHKDIDENILAIKHKEKEVYFVKWTGVTDDVNLYDGSKPRTIVEVEGDFMLKIKE